MVNLRNSGPVLLAGSPREHAHRVDNKQPPQQHPTPGPQPVSLTKINHVGGGAYQTSFLAYVKKGAMFHTTLIKMLILFVKVFFKYRAVSIPLDHSKRFTLFPPLADLFILEPTRLLGECIILL